MGQTVSATAGEITAEEITQAQQAWGEGIVAIGKVFTDRGDYSKAAENHIDTLYDFQSGTVLFKPTKAADKQFRLTREEALSYFVGGNEKYAEDHGFAIQPWVKVRFENAAIFLHGNYAVAMGNYFFTPLDGEEIKVEYSFGYIKDDAGKLR
ncbi:MAG: phosphoribosyl-AMP cyclohydrolase, partial [Thermodesulfobacteriota bacterium]|nr:phosphoribosyl-AMP cyclohydrolase [Thermodesulfobacteriota bacterium]